MRKTLLASTAVVLAAFGMTSIGTVTSASAEAKRRTGGNFKLCYGGQLSKFSRPPKKQPR